MLKKNSIYEIEATDLTDEGLGIGRAEGIAVFTAGLLPGEKAEVRIVKEAKRFAYGKIEKFIETSPARIEPVCPVSRSCGGCSLLNLDYEQQLIFKRNRVLSCFQRIGKLDVEVLPTIASPKKLRYRNKMAFPVSKTNGKVNIGCYRTGSHNVVDAKQCFLQSEKAERMTAIFREWLEKYAVAIYDQETKKGDVRYFVVRENAKGEQMCAVVTTKKLKYTESLREKLSAAGAVSVIENINRDPGNVILGKENHILFGQETITETLLGLQFDISLHSFLQVNREATELLYKTALDFAEIGKDDIVCDLYCGAGTIGLNAAKRAKAVFGVEIVPQAIENAKSNAKKNGTNNASFICADCDGGFDEIRKTAGKIDVVIVDPPRKGLAAGVVSSIAECGAERLVYVSCDPATLARDAALFHEKGFTIEKVQPVDMFPQTMHVETVVLMTKK